MDRKALLLYLRDIRDLEIVKKKIEIIYANEHSRIENNLKTLQEEKLHSEEMDLEGFGVPFLLSAFFAGVAYFLHWLANKWAPDLISQAIALVCKFGFYIVAITGIVLFGISVLIFLSEIINVRDARKYNYHEKECIKNNKEKAKKLKIYWENRKKYLNSEYGKVKDLLAEYYDLNIIPKPHRKLASMIYIYDYMSTSQATLESTLLHEHIEDGIQRILEHLNQIIANQEVMIYRQHKAEAQNATVIKQNQRMLQSLERSERSNLETSQYAKLAADYSRVTAFFSAATYLEMK